MDIDHNDNDMQAALRAGAGLADPKFLTAPDGSMAVMVPEGFSLSHLPPLDKPLSRIRAAVRMDDAESFNAYINTFKTPHSVVFADLKGNQLTGIIDYHQGAGVADYAVHRALHPCPWSIEWARWRAIDGQPFKQAGLAAFLEEMAQTIFSPESATLIEIATDLRIDREVKFKTGTRLQDGTVALAYEEADQTNGRGGKITVPDSLSIGSPVFMGGEVRMFKAKLRYKLERGELTFKIDILNRLEGEQEAFQEVVEDVKEQTGLPVFYGAPA